jgi:hypothetical protein
MITFDNPELATEYICYYHLAYTLETHITGLAWLDVAKNV